MAELFCFPGLTWTGVHDIAIADVDGDNKQDILVATDQLYDGRLHVIDGATHVLKNSYSYDSGSPLYQVTTADIDGNGDQEIIAGGGMEHTGSPGVFV